MPFLLFVNHMLELKRIINVMLHSVFLTPSLDSQWNILVSNPRIRFLHFFGGELMRLSEVQQ